MALWGSDGPYVATWGPMPAIGARRDLMTDGVPAPERRRRLFLDNPQHPYGFLSEHC